MIHISKYILIFCFLTVSIEVFGQIDNECDTVYSFVDTKPEYEKGVKGLMDYISSEIIPILSNCNERDDILIENMHLTLTIDKLGNVIEVDFVRINATDQCKNELKQKIISMSSWTPGKQNGTPVCCKYYWPINCIMWQ